MTGMDTTTYLPTYHVVQDRNGVRVWRENKGRADRIASTSDPLDADAWLITQGLERSSFWQCRYHGWTVGPPYDVAPTHLTTVASRIAGGVS